MANTLYDRTLAFAGIFQAVTLVQQIARQGQCDSALFEHTLNTIVKLTPSDTLDVFGELSHLSVGLEQLSKANEHSAQNTEIARYVISVLSLEGKLQKNNESMNELGQRLSTIERQLAHYQLLDEQMIDNLASIYLDVISPIGPRIQILGVPDILQVPINQQKIRALLLAAIRCAVLFRQVGGKKRHLLFGRKHLISEAQRLLQTC